jgi:signal transduction histidine kinase
LLWCAAAAFAVLLSRTLATDPHPFYLRQHRHLHTDPLLLAGLCVVVCAPLGLARSRPVPVFGVLLATMVVAAVLGERTWPFMVPVGLLLGYVAASRDRGIALTALVLAVLAAEAEALVSGSAIAHEVWNSTPFVLTMVLVWLGGFSVRQRREYATTLRAWAQQEAVVAERLRIARELHDTVAHSIGIIAIQAGAGSRVIETRPLDARDALRSIETTSREMLSELRRMVGALRQTEPECAGEADTGLDVEPPSAPGLADVDRLADSLAETGVRVEVRWHGARHRLPPEIDLAAFRIIQESMTNVVRHAHATACWVSVEYGTSDLTIEIVDDGRGAHPEAVGAAPASGFGIAGMRERADVLNGVLDAGPRDCGGFRVAARLPL